MMDPEIGHTVFFNAEEAEDVCEFLKEEGYTPNAEGMRKLLLDVARDEFFEEDEAPMSPTEKLARALKDPEVLKAANTYGPLVFDALRRLAGRV